MKRSAALSMAVAVACCGMTGQAATKTWDGSTAGYRSPNWSGTLPAAGDELTLSTGTIDGANASPAGAVVLSPSSSDGRRLNVTGGSLALGGVGTDTILRVETGGALDVSGGSLMGERLVFSGGSYLQTGGSIAFTNIDLLTGLMDLRGGTVSWTGDKRLTIGSSDSPDTARVEITKTGHINSTGQIYIGTEGGKGAVSVVGPQARMDVGPHIWIGYLRSATGAVGTGSLSIHSGGVATTTAQVIVGQYGGTGVLEVDGVGSLLQSTDGVGVAHSRDWRASSNYGPSHGSMTITNGAMADVGNVMIASHGGIGTGVITGVGTRVNTGGLLVAAQRYTNTITGVIGPAAQGDLTVSDGAQITARGGTTVGTAGGIGRMVVTGANTAIDIPNGWLRVGEYRQIHQGADIGAGDGDLRVEQGARIAWSACVGVGYEGGTGLVRVAGAGSRLYSTEGWGALFIGDGRMKRDGVDFGPGNGEVRITNGGRVDATIGSYPVALVSMIGSRGGYGSVTVDGQGSLLTVTNAPLWIGHDRPTEGGSVGAMNVSGGAMAITAAAAVGSKGGTGTVTLTGTDTLWRAGVHLYIGSSASGEAGEGQVNVQDGARLEVNGNITVAPGVSNRLSIERAGVIAAQVLNSGRVELASATLTGNLSSSGILSVSGPTAISGDLNITGGTLAFDLDASTTTHLLSVGGALRISGATLQLTGGTFGQQYTLLDCGSTTGSFTSVSAGYDLSYSGSGFTVQVVPEPAAGGALLVMFTMLLRRRRA